MNWATIRTLASRVPGMAYVMVFIITLLIAAVAGLVHYGETRGSARVVAKARADSVTHQRSVIQQAAVHADSALVDAHASVKQAATQRTRAREAVHDTANHTAPSVLALVDSAFAMDSSAIAHQDTAIVAKNAEVIAFQQLDTLEQHQVAVTPPGLTIVDVAITTGKLAVVAGTVYEGVRAVRWLLRMLQ